jgi:integrase
MSPVEAVFARARPRNLRPQAQSWATVKFFEEKASQLVRILEHERDSDEGVLPCTCASGHCEAYRPLKLVDLEPPQGAEMVDWYIGLRRSEWAVRPRRAEYAADGTSLRPGREGRHVSEHTIHKELVVLRSALKLAKRRGLWSGDLDAVLPVGFAPDYEPVERWLTRPEIEKLIGELTPDHAARVAFMVGGAEWNATERAQREDIAADLSSVRIRGTKRKTRDRVVQLVMQWQKDLVGFARDHAQGKDDALFAFWQNRVRDIKAACERAKIEPCSPNDLRRTCMTWLRAEGMLPSEIAPFAGHVDSRMVEKVYGRLNPDQLAAVMEGRAAGCRAANAASQVTAPVPARELFRRSARPPHPQRSSHLPR